MKKILMYLFLPLSLAIYSCKEESNYGTYLVKYDNKADTLIIYPDGTFYHVVYDIKRERIKFVQRSNYQRVGDDGFSLPEYKRSTDSDYKGWDFQMTTYFFRKAIYYDVVADLYYVKQ